MKKLLVILILLSIIASAFANGTEKKVVLKSTVSAGNGIGDPEGSSVIKNDESGYWVAMTYTTDIDTTPKNLGANGEEIAVLTTDTNAQGARSLDFQVRFAGNTLADGTTGTITIATDGWKGEKDASNEDQSVDIKLSLSSSTSTSSKAVVDEATTTKSSVSFNVLYPAGLIKSEEIAIVAASWDKSDNLKAGDYSATINVSVTGE